MQHFDNHQLVIIELVLCITSISI